MHLAMLSEVVKLMTHQILLEKQFSQIQKRLLSITFCAMSLNIGDATVV